MKTSNIRNYKVCSNQSYFFDTNIWMFLFAPIAGTNQYKQKQYSRLFNDILTCRSTIFISSLVIAEYVNAVLRLGFFQWKRENCYPGVEVDYKRDYRPTDAYLDSLQEVKIQVKEIMKVARNFPDDFNTIDVDSLFSLMDGKCDFCDAYIEDLCCKHELRLVTDDRDIASAEHQFTVITI